MLVHPLLESGKGFSSSKLGPGIGHQMGHCYCWEEARPPAQMLRELVVKAANDLWETMDRRAQRAL